MKPSTRHLLPLLALALAAPVHLTAQETDARLQYEAAKKSEPVAAALEAMLPVLGHAYAGDARRGLKSAVVSTAGLVAVFVTDNLTVARIGVLAYVGGRAWGIYSAYGTAMDANRALRERLGIPPVGLSVTPNRQVALTVRVSF